MHYDRITTTTELEWLSESSRARRRSSAARSSLTGRSGSRRVVNEPSSGHCLGIAPWDGGWSNFAAICHPAEIGKPRLQTSNFVGADFRYRVRTNRLCWVLSRRQSCPSHFTTPTPFSRPSAAVKTKLWRVSSLFIRIQLSRLDGWLQISRTSTP